jgi:uncharacterized repeat protein (TIGR03803 family)
MPGRKEYDRERGFMTIDRRDSALPLAVVFLSVIIGAPAIQAQTYTVLHTFQTSDGGNPFYGSLVRDSAGNLYGTTIGGGTAGAGVVFKVDAQGHETVLHDFAGGTDGANPYAGVIRDAAGNLYGTTFYGGPASAGVIFKLDTTGAETILYSFKGSPDGANPEGGLFRESDGNLYGTTSTGGAYGKGAVFEMDTTGTETVLYSFTGGTDGAFPTGGVIRDAAGYFCGTTNEGGTMNYGVVFCLGTAGHEKVLHNFKGDADGRYPQAGLLLDSSGNLYGDTVNGGTTDEALGSGVVFKIAPDGVETVLYEFTNSADGAYPSGALVMDAAGNLYGTTQQGGQYDRGAVFMLDPAGTETVLESFKGAQGTKPYAGVILDSAGTLFGTTEDGGNGVGVVFKLVTAPAR